MLNPPHPGQASLKSLKKYFKIVNFMSNCLLIDSLDKIMRDKVILLDLIMIQLQIKTVTCTHTPDFTPSIPTPKDDWGNSERI